MYIYNIGVMTKQPYTPIDYQYLTQLADLLARFSGRSEATISQKIVGHARLFSRLNSGSGCNAHTYQNAMNWFSEHWPADLEWPADIPRPDVSRNERKAS
tara:strand:- start:117 stop:416 length:300 start_codon:yes stop_codon:yes gene_type:complete